MPVLLDTGVLIAWLHTRDGLHERAGQIMREVLEGQQGIPLTLDLVLAEGLTYLRRRPARRDISEAFSEALVGGPHEQPLVNLVSTTPELLRRARDLHFEHYDRALSFTDCALIAHARAAGARVATFDRGFLGLVRTLPESA